MDHDDAVSRAFRCYEEAVQLLQDAADLMRGPHVDPSREAMRVEIALSRALESLQGTVLAAPRRAR